MEKTQNKRSKAAERQAKSYASAKDAGIKRYVVNCVPEEHVLLLDFCRREFGHDGTVGGIKRHRAQQAEASSRQPTVMTAEEGQVPAGVSDKSDLISSAIRHTSPKKWTTAAALHG